MKFKLRVLVIIVASVFVLAAANSAYSEVILKQGTMYPEGSNYGKAMNKFSELAHKYSNGEVNVKVYHAGQLGKKMQLIENIQRGATDVYIETVDVFETYVPEVYFQSMPYLFRDVDHARKFLRSDWFEKNINAKFKARGFMAVEQAFNWERGPYRVLITKIPVMTVDDMKKIKLRVYASETYRKAWQTLGANTTNVDWTEVYLAMKQNLIQGVTSPINLVRPMKFAEVAKYITRINEFPQLLIVLFNKKSYGKLSPPQKAALRKAYDEAGKYYADINYGSAEVDIANMLEENGATFTRVPLPEWRKKIKPFYQELEKAGSVQKGFYDMIQSLK